jgi:hypothetical protein
MREYQTVVKASSKGDLKEAAARTAEAQPKTSTALVNFFLATFLPILPGLLLTAAPKIMKSPRLLTVLRQVDVVLDQILEQVEE